MTMRRIDLQPLEPFTSDFIDRTGAFNPGALEAATAIIEQVRRDGDAALRALTEKFDGVAIENFRVPGEAIDAAMAEVDPDTLEALKHAAAQIRDFHERQKQQSWFFAREDGAIVGSKVTPLESVGIYVPGGRALYPSTVLMNALPAQVAGVERVVCVTPPTKDGTLDAAILAACKIAGVTEIYTVGGAQAVAALAYGTETIRPVAKITGPGNAFVAAAKKLVSGDVGIDMIAGPSEVCVVADETADPGGWWPSISWPRPSTILWRPATSSPSRTPTPTRWRRPSRCTWPIPPAPTSPAPPLTITGSSSCALPWIRPWRR